MKYIHTYKGFKQVNEEFLGNLMNSLKNKMSLSLSKTFGKAKDADQAIENYKEEVLNAYGGKEKALMAFGEYIKGLKGGDVDKDRVSEFKGQIQQADDNYKKQLEIIKQKYDIKLKDIIDKEENKKITNYIKIKKLEMEQETLANEIQVMQKSGISQDFINNDQDFSNMINRINGRIKSAQQESKVQAQEITKEVGEKKTAGFDMNAAKASAKNEEDKPYRWSKGKFANGQHDFKKGESIMYFSNTNYKEQGDKYDGTKATIVNVLEDSIEVKTDGEPFTISKGSVIKSFEGEDIPKVQSDQV